MKAGIAVAVAAIVAAAIGFGGGYWVGQKTGPSNDLVLGQLAQIQKDIEGIKKARALPAPTPQRRAGPDRNKVYKVDTAGSPGKGTGTPTVTIVEFSDFQCPYCGRVTPALNKLLEDYPDDVRLVYMHLPLAFHKSAVPAAKAAAAKARTGESA